MVTPHRWQSPYTEKVIELNKYEVLIDAYTAEIESAEIVQW